MQFQKIDSTNDIQEIIHNAFNMKLDINGSWGYDQNNPTIINSLGEFAKEELQLTLISMRAHIEMSMMLSEEDRYGGINPSEISREEIILNNKVYEKVIYKISATKDLLNKKLMKEYKERLGQEDFDIEAHFKEREKNSLEIISEYWYDIRN